MKHHYQQHINIMNIFINYEIPHDIFSEILSYIYSGPLTNNVMNFFSTSKDLRLTYLKEFCNYIRFQQVPHWIPSEYIKHFGRYDKKLETTKYDERTIITKRRKIELVEPRQGLSIETYKVDRPSTFDHWIKEQPLKELYIKETSILELVNLTEGNKIEKLIIEDLTHNGCIIPKTILSDNFQSLKCLKINPEVKMDLVLPEKLEKLIICNNSSIYNSKETLTLPENLKVLHVGEGFFNVTTNFPSSIKELKCDYVFEYNINFKFYNIELPKQEEYTREKFFNEAPVFLTEHNRINNRGKNKRDIDYEFSQKGIVKLHGDHCVILYRYFYEEKVKLCRLDKEVILSTILSLKEGSKLHQIELHKGKVKTQIYTDDELNILNVNSISGVIDYLFSSEESGFKENVQV